MFWVISARSRPSSASRARPRWPAFGSAAAKSVVHLEAAAPVLQPRLLGGDEILVGDRLACRASRGRRGCGNRECRIPSRCRRRSARRSAPSCAIRRAERRNFLVAFSVPHHIFPRRKKEPDMRYLHTMVRVTDVDQSLDFYVNKLGMREVRRHTNEAGRYTLIFLAAPEDEKGRARRAGAASRAHLQLGSGEIRRRPEFRPPRLRGRQYLRHSAASCRRPA